MVALATSASYRDAVETVAAVDIDQPLRQNRVVVGTMLPAEPALQPGPPPKPGAQPTPAYTATLLQDDEEEIVGEVYHRALAGRLSAPAQKQAMRALAEVEADCAALVASPIRRYGLTLTPPDALTAAGAGDAAPGPQDRDGMVAWMRATFPAGMTDFLRQEAMAPGSDRAAPKRMTRHQAVAVASPQVEAAGTADDGTAPLRHFPSTPVDGSLAA